MALELESDFTRFSLTDLEYRAAVEFTPQLRNLLQTYKGDLAHSILQLSFRKEEVEESLIMHRYLSGKLDIIRELLDLKEMLDEEKVPEESEDVKSGRNPQL